MQKLTLKDNTNYVTQMRNLKDKKGGGIMLLYNKKNHIEKLDSGHSDVLYVNSNVNNLNFKMITTYLDVKDINKNHKIKEITMKILEKNNNEDIPLILLGDFNAHLGFLGNQKLDVNGNLLLDIAEKYNLIILNGDPLCKGEITWSRNNLKSTKDFILCNQVMYKKFKRMNIDEEKEEFELSDHHLLKAYFELNHKNERNKEKSKEIKYLKIDNKTTEKYIKRMEDDLKDKIEDIELKDLEEMVIKNSKIEMERTIWRKIDKSKELEPIWFTKEIKKRSV